MRDHASEAEVAKELVCTHTEGSSWGELEYGSRGLAVVLKLTEH